MCPIVMLRNKIFYLKMKMCVPPLGKILVIDISEQPLVLVFLVIPDWTGLALILYPEK